MAQTIPQVCQLSHAGFRMLGEPLFRLSEDTRVPSMVVRLQSQEAVLPLRSVAREFGVEPDTVDGRMLALIEQALDFVVAIRLGDTFPTELNGGEASWKPSDADRRIALSRVWHDLVRCVFARQAKSVKINGIGSPGWEELAASRPALRQAIDGAVILLAEPDAEGITARVLSIGEELAYIETMRRAVAKGMAAPREKLMALAVNQLGTEQRETLKQVQSLMRRGLKEITGRFDAVDARLDDFLSVLPDTNATIAWLRQQRDWLVRTKQAWDPLFTDWANAPRHFDEFLWKVIERTYGFLAPRYMTFQEWKAVDTKPDKRGPRAKVW